jgi:hypothetical protein
VNLPGLYRLDIDQAAYSLPAAEYHVLMRGPNIDDELVLRAEVPSSGSGGGGGVPELRHAVGETIRLHASLSLAGLTPTVRIRRKSDGRYYNGSIALPLDPFQVAVFDNPMLELAPVQLPGVYYFDFPQSRDLLGMSQYLVHMANSSPAEKQDLVLLTGPFLSPTEVAMCTVFGTILDPHGRPRPNIAAKATVIPVALVAPATGISLVEIDATTDENGLFSMSLAQGLRVRLEIPEIGYDKRVLIPALSSADFTTL